MALRTSRLWISLAVLWLCACAEPPSTTWQANAIASPAPPDSGEPHLAWSDLGYPVLSWIAHGEDASQLQFSRWQNGVWTEPETVAEGDEWFVNWADVPSVVPIKGGLWAAHWLLKQPGPAFAYHVAMTVSDDAGKTWSTPFRPHDDASAAEHGFVSLFPWQQGVGVAWLDGRDSLESPQPSPMALRMAGFSGAGAVGQREIVDPMVCDCCQTAAASTRSGVILAYRNRSPDEVRDIYVARGSNDRWSPPVQVARDGWKISGCPVNGPAIDARNATVVVAWYTNAAALPEVFLARSFDDGITFEPPLRIDTGALLGRVDVVLQPDDSAVVGWLRRGGDGNGEYCVRRVSRNGDLGPINALLPVGLSRSAGFPQMAYTHDGLVVAYTDTSEAIPRVVTYLLHVADI